MPKKLDNTFNENFSFDITSNVDNSNYLDSLHKNQAIQNFDHHTETCESPNKSTNTWPEFKFVDDNEKDAVNGIKKNVQRFKKINVKRKTNPANSKCIEKESLNFMKSVRNSFENFSNFYQLSLSRPLLKALTDMNFSSPTPIQSASMPHLLRGSDVFACAATGTGKTIAYLLPILERLIFKPGHKESQLTRVLILLPTRELATQVYKVGKDLLKYISNIYICLAIGGENSKIQEDEVKRHPDVLVATPGRLLDLLCNTPTFDLDNVEILVLDEADRLLDQHFEEQINEIIENCSIDRQTLLFSATLSDRVQDLAAACLNTPVKIFVDSNTTIAYNLRQEFVKVRNETQRTAMIITLVKEIFTEESIMLFVPTKLLAHNLVLIFKAIKLSAAELHGDLKQRERKKAMADFCTNKYRILVCSDLAARGLDIKGVDVVMNYTIPKTYKEYVHRVGRTARAGSKGTSISLIGDRERGVMKEIVKNSLEICKKEPHYRKLPMESVLKWLNKFESLEDDIKKQKMFEEEDKEIKSISAEMDRIKKKLNKTPKEAKIESNEEQRQWFKEVNKGKRKYLHKISQEKARKIKSVAS